MSREYCGCGRPMITWAGEREAACGGCQNRPDACDCQPPGGSPDPGTAAESLTSRLLPGGCILDVPRVPDALWGDGDDILWAKGQALIIAGPDGTGKTTLAGNLVQARLGLGTGSVLGLPVKPAGRNVLVLLMDRPQQAMAALARLFCEDDRELLDARLRVWRGPPPQDLARSTHLLTELCTRADADTCLIDSLKDAALRLTDDETGAGWNQARQLAIEAGTQLLELHHPRKGQEGNRKPSKLDDLYGSRLIGAGSGSVISLWGQAGDPVVELTQIKPIVRTIAPLQMSIDASSGLVSTGHGVDLLEQIMLRGRHGLTAAGYAQLVTGTDKPERAAVERARRELGKKEAAGILVRRDSGTGRGHESVWFLAEQRHGESHAPTPAEKVTNKVTANSRPGQKATPLHTPRNSRKGGDISPPFRDFAGAAAARASRTERKPG